MAKKMRRLGLNWNDPFGSDTNGKFLHAKETNGLEGVVEQEVDKEGKLMYVGPDDVMKELGLLEQTLFFLVLGLMVVFMALVWRGVNRRRRVRHFKR